MRRGVGWVLEGDFRAARGGKPKTLFEAALVLRDQQKDRAGAPRVVLVLRILKTKSQQEGGIELAGESSIEVLIGLRFVAMGLIELGFVAALVAASVCLLRLVYAVFDAYAARRSWLCGCGILGKLVLRLLGWLPLQVGLLGLRTLLAWRDRQT